MSNSTGVLLKAGTACPSQAHEFTPGFLWGPCCLYFYFLCCHIVCFFRSGFHVVMSATISTWKRCSVRIFLQLFVGDSCIVCVICFVLAWVWWCPARIVLCFCFVFRRLLCPMLPVSLDCSFVIATWPYSLTFILTVNRHDDYICIGQYTPTEPWLIIDL